MWKLYEKDDFTKVKAKRYQVPLKLAWVFTVLKAQGMTVDAVKVNVSGIFVPGHLYQCGPIQGKVPRSDSSRGLP